MKRKPIVSVEPGGPSLTPSVVRGFEVCVDIMQRVVDDMGELGDERGGDVAAAVLYLSRVIEEQGGEVKP